MQLNKFWYAILAINAFWGASQEQNRKHLLRVDKESPYAQERISSDTTSRDTYDEQNDFLYVLAQEWAERKFARTKYLEFEKIIAIFLSTNMCKVFGEICEY